MIGPMTGTWIAFAAIGALWLVVSAAMANRIWTELRGEMPDAFHMPIVAAVVIAVLSLLWPVVILLTVVRGGRGA